MDRSRNQRRLDRKKNASPPALQALLDEALRHHRAGQLAEAEKIYRQILAADPRHAASLHLLGVLAGQAGHHDDALGLIRQAAELNPDAPLFHISLGNVFKTLGRGGEAAACYARALALDPGDAEARNDFGLLLHDGGRPDEAAAQFRQALALRPESAEIHNNLGLALKNLGQLDEALSHYTRAIALKPDYAEAHWNLGFIQLLTGDFAEGWRENEWRLRMPGAPAHGLATPAWDGGAPAGRTILLHGEQGLGDSIQFIRYAPLVKAQGATVLLACAPPLASLFEGAAGIDRIFSGGGVPAHDCHASLMSLPAIFDTAPDTVPAATPYLRADETRAAIWRERLAAAGGFKVGISWRGNPAHKNDHNRSMTAAQFAKALALPGLSVVSLQKDARADELAMFESLSGSQGNSFLDAGTGAGDFADTAAVMAGLDLVLTVDTSICHLAGALAVPVWTLIPFAPDWRWQLGRADSPWYPSMRLFRQEKRGDWAGVMETARANLLKINKL